jgi:DNA mismatch endonuclease (patch repair protein)
MDNLTPEQRKKNMQHIRSKNTKPEIMLRKHLWLTGLRYRIHGKNIIGKPDIYFKSKKIAIFVDSDFWHGRLYKEGKAVPKTNQDYWIPKLENNIKRDEKVNAALLSEGWTVIRCWESSLKKNIDACVNQILYVIKHPKNKLFLI